MNSNCGLLCKLYSLYLKVEQEPEKASGGGRRMTRSRAGVKPAINYCEASPDKDDESDDDEEGHEAVDEV